MRTAINIETMTESPSEQKMGLDFVRAWGRNSNSFLALYPGFKWYRHPDASVQGGISYVETGKLWVASGDPCADEEDSRKLLVSFAEHATNLGCSVAFIPVAESTAVIARELGYGSVMIGSEPIFDLRSYACRTGGSDWGVLMQSARALSQKGARVIPFTAAGLNPGEREELDAITAEWLASRKMAPLSFLNRVEPWTASEHKRYFRVELRGQMLAFVAAIPIWARNGWYLIDVMRRSDSPAGTVELLLLESMRLLKSEGAEHISLGIAPLSNLDRAHDRAERPRLYRILDYAYENLNQLYNFKSLHQFKQKFQPTTYEPALLLYYPAKLRPSQLGELLGTFVPGGVPTAVLSFASRLFLRIDLLALLYRTFDFEGVTLPRARHGLFHQLKRIKVTLSLLSMLFVFKIAAPNPTLIADYVFSGASLPENAFKVLLVPSFLHWSTAHLLSNCALMVLFTGMFEYAFGVRAALLCFFVPAMTANFLTLSALSPLKTLAPATWAALLADRDVGASLGILGTIGALAGCARSRMVLLTGATVITATICVAQNSLLQLNHIVALALGWLLARIIL